MGCKFQEKCGGCCFRDLTIEQYREKKFKHFKDILTLGLGIKEKIFDEPCFISDGTRRRASFTFEYKKNNLYFGFNEQQSNNIANCDYCPMLTDKINNNLGAIKEFVFKLCQIKTLKKTKGKKFIESHIFKGDILVLDALNGIDIVLEFCDDLELNHRMEIFDFVNAYDDIIRVSHRKDAFGIVEPIIEKTKPVIKISEYDVYVSPGMFLQASSQGEEALVSAVMKYIGQTRGIVADLFCGIGTFSYPLAKMTDNKIMAVDVNKGLLDGFKTSINKQMIHNIDIVERNLFKYPLTASELEHFDAVLFDPPRAGANAIVKELANIEKTKKVKKIIAVSCNPHSFVKDAKILIDAGYNLTNVTLVDQFVYSKHMELVALFTTN